MLSLNELITAKIHVMTSYPTVISSNLSHLQYKNILHQHTPKIKFGIHGTLLKPESCSGILYELPYNF
jgi:hypothetical protein